MPNFNQTGPMGQGPMTGRRMGRCTNYGANLKKDTTPGNESHPADDYPTEWGRGRGLGRPARGRRQGMGRQNRFRSSI